MRFHIELLEPRETPAAFVGVQGGVLAVVAIGGGPHAVIMSEVGANIQVTADFVVSKFPKSAVKQAVVVGDLGSQNFILDNLDVPAVILGGGKADVIAAPLASTTIIPGGGADAIVATMGSAVFSDLLDVMFRVPKSQTSVTDNATFGIAPERASANATYAAAVFGQPPQFTDLFGPVTG